MTLDERLSLLWKTLQKLTPEEIDKELDGAGAPLKGRTALFSTEIISNPTEMLIKDFKPEENTAQMISIITTEEQDSVSHEGGIVSNNLRAA
jgi:hypothetical protein